MSAPVWTDCNVEFIGDFFFLSTNVSVEGEYENGTDCYHEAIAAANAMLKEYYGWNVASVSTIEITVTKEGSYHV